MENSARFMADEADLSDPLIDRLPWSTRLWLAFQAGVMRNMDLLSVSINLVETGTERDQVLL